MESKLTTFVLAVLLLPTLSHAQHTQTQSEPDWGLDRVDQRTATLDDKYIYDWTGEGVRIYVLDTGVKASHNDFGGRVVGAGDFIQEAQGSDTEDCNGHGTRVAGVAAGTTWGAAKLADIWSMKTSNCNSTPSRPAIKDALKLLLDDPEFDHENENFQAVINFSAELDPPDNEIDSLVTDLASDRGISFVHAAGAPNGDEDDACDISPVSVHAISVAASKINDARATISRTGSCVDIFAPGVEIETVDHLSDTGSVVVSGTSLSSPFVAAKIALFLHQNENTHASTIKERITTYNATHNVLSGVPGDTPNKLLFTRDELYRPGIAVTLSACDTNFNAIYSFFSDGDYGSETELYTREIAIGGVEPWDEIDSSTQTSTTFSVPSNTDFKVRARYDVSPGTSANNTSGMIRSPDCASICPSPPCIFP